MGKTVVRSARSADSLTSRKQAKHILRQHDEKYRGLFATVPDAVMIFCADTKRFIDVNHAAVKLYGYSKEEFLKLRHSDITDEPEQSDASIKQTLAGQLDRIPVRYHKKKDGTIFPVEISACTFTVGGRKVLCGVVRDITERKQAEQAVRESEERYRTLVDNNPYGIQEIDTSGTIIFANKAHHEMYGCEQGYLIGRSITDFLIPGTQHDALPGYLEQLVKNQPPPTPYHQKILTKQGKERDIEVVWNYLRDSKGGVRGFLSILTDITERKRDEEALKQSEEKFRLLFDTMLDGFALHEMIFDDEGNPVDYRFLEVNAAFEKLTGLTRDKVIGRTVLEVLPNIDKYWIETFGKVVTTGKANRFEEYFRELDRHYKAVVYRPREGQFANIFEDITEQQRTEEANRELSRLNQILLDSFPCVAFLLRPHSRKIVASNKAAVKVGAVPGTQCFATWGQRSDPCPWCLAPEVWSTGKAQHLEVDALGITWDTHWIPVSEDLYMHFAFDITERRQAEKEIEKLAKFPDENPYPVFKIAKDATILYANKAGAPVLEMWGRSVGQRVPEPCCNRIDEALSSGKLYTFELDCSDRVFSITIAPVAGSDYANAYGVDITEQKRLQDRILKISDEMQREIGRDLHDGLGQQLTGAMLLCQSLADKLAAELSPHTAEVERICRITKEALEQSSNLARLLNPVDLRSTDFLSAVKILVRKMEHLFDVACVFHYDPSVRIEDMTAASQIYRIIQEAMNNSIKHGHAGHIWIALRDCADTYVLTVQDDGVSLSEETKRGRHMGLQIMEYRAKTLGGAFEIRRGESGGTVVTCSFPRASCGFRILS